jgi:hypothetical protein
MPNGSTLSRRSSLLWGLLCIALSLGVAAMVHWRPQQLNAPAWVVYCAAAAFFFAGLILLAAAAGSPRIQDWLAVALILAMLVPGSWVAFGPGERHCSASFPIPGVAPATACRGAFGLGTVICAGVLLLAIRLALRGPTSR